jgi:hypothetical protein
MARTYIEAYRSEGDQVLGNLDGQTSYSGPLFHRTLHYKALLSGDNRPKWPRIAFWRVVDDRGHLLKTIRNVYHKDCHN